MGRFLALAVIFSILASRAPAQESRTLINASAKASVVETPQHSLRDVKTDAQIDDLPMDHRKSFITLTPLVPSAKNSARLEVPPEKMAPVIVSVYNDVGVPEGILVQAEQEASRVFRHARIEVRWLNCKNLAALSEESRKCPASVYPQRLDLRIVGVSLNTEARGEGMGISFLDDDGRGCCADLFYGPMKELHKTKGTDLATLLGLVAAHELGHLLLGPHSHSVAGIMHAPWTAAELASTRVGRLVFLDQESRQMRERLLSESPASEEGSLATTTRSKD